jgi:hypothetical protein
LVKLFAGWQADCSPLHEGEAMNRIARLSILCLVTAGLSLAAEMLGWVTDHKCALTGEFTGTQHKACVDAGQPIVFVNEADKKIYTLTDSAKARDFVGQKVVMHGQVKGDAIEVTMVESAK